MAVWMFARLLHAHVRLRWLELPSSVGMSRIAQVQARLPWFMEARPSAACAKGGAGAYSDSLQRSSTDPGNVAGLERGVVAASAFRTSYVPLSRQTDFIDGLKARGGTRAACAPSMQSCAASAKLSTSPALISSRDDTDCRLF